MHSDASPPRVIGPSLSIPAELIRRLLSLFAFHDEALAAYQAQILAPRLGAAPRDVVVIHVVGDPRACVDDAQKCVQNLMPGQHQSIDIVPLYAGDALLGQVASMVLPFYRR